MADKKMMNVIVSTCIRFNSEDDVKAYQGLSLEALPKFDTGYTECTRYVMGANVTVLYGANGQRLAVLKRSDIAGFAVDGVPVPVHGPEFRRMDSADPTWPDGPVPADNEAEVNEDGAE